MYTHTLDYYDSYLFPILSFNQLWNQYQSESPTWLNTQNLIGYDLVKDNIQSYLIPNFIDYQSVSKVVKRERSAKSGVSGGEAVPIPDMKLGLKLSDMDEELIIKSGRPPNTGKRLGCEWLNSQVGILTAVADNVFNYSGFMEWANLSVETQLYQATPKSMLIPNQVWDQIVLGSESILGYLNYRLPQENIHTDFAPRNYVASHFSGVEDLNKRISKIRCIYALYDRPTRKPHYNNLLKVLEWLFTDIAAISNNYLRGETKVVVIVDGRETLKEVTMGLGTYFGEIRYYRSRWAGSDIVIVASSPFIKQARNSLKTPHAIDEQSIDKLLSLAASPLKVEPQLALALYHLPNYII